MMTQAKVITKETIAQSMDYEQYRAFITERIKNNQFNSFTIEDTVKQEANNELTA